MSVLHVLFKVAGAEYALAADQILQIDSYAGATPVPGAPEFVEGIIQVRGRVVPVIDLRSRMRAPRAELTPDSRVLVVEHGARTVALRVDSSREVMKLESTAIASTPSVIAEQQAYGYVRSIAQVGPRLILLIDLQKVLGDEQLHDESFSRLESKPSGVRALPG